MEYQAGLDTTGTRSGAQRLSTAEKKRLKRARRAARKAAAAQSQSEFMDQGQGGSSYRHSAGPHHPLLPPSVNTGFDASPTSTHARRAGPHPDFPPAAAQDTIDTVAGPLPAASQKRAADVPADQGQAKRRRRMLVLAIDFWSFLKELAGTAVGCSMGWALGWLVEDLRKTTGAEVVLLIPEASIQPTFYDICKCIFPLSSDREEYRWQCMLLCSEHDMTLYTADRQAMLDVVYKAEHPAAPSILKVDICTFERSKNPDNTPVAAPRPVSPANGALWKEHTASIGRPYYFNMQTGQSVWEKPVELLTPAEKADPTKIWTEHARADGRVYYFNKLTQVSTWTVPEDLKAARDKHTSKGTADGQPPADDFQVGHLLTPTTDAGANILTHHSGSPGSATPSAGFLTRPSPLPDSVPPSFQPKPRQVLGRLDGNGLSDVVKARSPAKVHSQAMMPIKEIARVGAVGESALEKGEII